MMPAVLLCGPAGVGKDTVADLILEFIPGSVKLAQADAIKDFCRDALGLSDRQLYGSLKEKEKAFVLRPGKHVVTRNADWTPAQRRRIYQVVPAWLSRLHVDVDEHAPSLFSWIDRLPRKTTPRHIMQTLGTEWGRSVDPLLWAKDAWRRVNASLVAGASFVAVTDGRFRNEILYATYQHAPSVLIKRDVDGLKGKHGKHASETEIEKVPRSWFTSSVNNNFSLATLREQVKARCSGLGYFT